MGLFVTSNAVCITELAVVVQEIIKKQSQKHLQNVSGGACSEHP